jgi:hypothetical protein
VADVLFIVVKEATGLCCIAGFKFIFTCVHSFQRIFDDKKLESVLVKANLETAKENYSYALRGCDCCPTWTSSMNGMRNPA